MKQDFDTGELKSLLEKSLGFCLSSLVRLDGASALNFRAERAADGLAFAVKCSPRSRQVMFDHLVNHLRETEGTKAVRRLFAETCPSTFRGYNVICLSWCDGLRRFPDQLTESQLLAFLDEYQLFSKAMQGASGILPHDPMLVWRTQALASCRGFWGGRVRRLIAREIPASSVTYRRERLKVIHGDFHHGNFLFSGEKVSGFFDLEEFCEGYPADDVIRYFVCAAEHLRWYEYPRLGRILSRFSAAVRHLPYPREEWETAIDGLLLRKIYMKTRDGGVGFARAANLLFRARFYRRLRRRMEEVLG